MSSPGRLTVPRAPAASNPQSQVKSGIRKRKVLSCYDCRRRKMKCDRESPTCGRCRKAGLASTCSYDEQPAPSKQRVEKDIGTDTAKGMGVDIRPKPSALPSSSTNQRTNRATPIAAPRNQPLPATSQTAHLPSQENQISRLENRLSILEANVTSGTWQGHGEIAPATEIGEGIPASPRGSSAPPETVIFRGKNFGTQYYGGSNPTSLIAHFPELRSFVREVIMQHSSESSLPRVQRDIKGLLAKWKEDKPNVLPVTDSQLHLLLPDKTTVDRLVYFYFDNLEPIYRILHRPSFWKEYEMFWEAQETAESAFIVLILLVMASVSCISPEEKPSTYVGDSSITRERAILWISVSEWWLGCHSQKNIYLAIWQIRCLLVLAKQINIVKKKRHWTVAGTLVREAISAGFHRDPTLLGGKVSVFDQEIRRRLWATMVELELQTSVDRGMPSALAGIPSDCDAVSNIDDEELTIECETLPFSKPWTQYTGGSFLHISKASFALRVSLTSRVNDLSTPLLYEEVLSYEERIMKELQKIPLVAETGEKQDSRGIPAMARTLLDVQLRQFLLLLHAPFARQTDANSRYALSRMICFNAAASIIEQYSTLNKSGSSLLLLLRQEYFMSALVICHNLSISMSLQNDLFLHSNADAFIQYVEETLVLLSDRISLLGTGYTHYWYISTGCSLIRSAVSPGALTQQKQQAIERLTKQYYRVLGSQEEFPRAKEKIVPVSFHNVITEREQLQISIDMPTIPVSSFLDTSVPQTEFNEIDVPLEEFYYGDPAVWTFDDLWEFE